MTNWAHFLDEQDSARPRPAALAPHTQGANQSLDTTPLRASVCVCESFMACVILDVRQMKMLEPVSLVVLGVLVSLVPSGGQFHAFRVWIRPKEGALPLRAVASVVCVTACRTRRYSATPVRRAERHP